MLKQSKWKYGLFGLIVGFVGFSHKVSVGASIVTANVAVRVESGLCGHNESKYQGSGFLLKQAGKVYVVTSNHILLNGNETYCHHASNAAIGIQKAKLVVSDWGAGLALLELESATAVKSAVTLADFASVAPLKNAKMVVAGYPHSQTKLLEDSHGYVLMPKSGRHLFAQAVPIVELLGTHVEFGMSGGLVTDGLRTKVTGLISHQALVMVAGGKTRVVLADEQTQLVRNHALIIPASFVANWLKSALKPDFVPSVIELPEDQLKSRNVVVMSGLRFEAKTLSGNTPAGVGGKEGGGHGSGVGGKEGGGHGSGVGGKEGGGHGSGVGGDEQTSASPDEPIEITVTLDASKRPAEFGRIDREAWIKSMKAALLAQKKVRVLGIVKRNDLSQAFLRSPVFGLQDFFRALLDSSNRPMTWIEGQSGSAETAAIAPHLANVSAKTKELLPKVSNSSAQGLLQRIQVMSELAMTTEWAMVTKEDWAAVTAENGVYRAGWVSLMSDTDGDAKRFTAAVELMRSLHAISDVYPSFSDGK